MAQRTVLKVDLSCAKCKKKLLKAVSALEGVDKVETDVGKGTLSVTGNADPYKIIVSARKATGRHVDVVSVGPPPAAQKKPEEKKKEKKEEVVSFCDPRPFMECQRVVFVPMDRPWNCNEPDPSCCVM